MEIVRTTYSELRSASASVIAFLEKEYWWEEERGLKTELENDLGITGDDGAELMEKFSKQFAVDISSFEFDQYFYPEPSGSNPLVLIYCLLLLIAFLLKVLLAVLLLPFSPKKGRQIWKHSLTSRWNRWTEEWFEDKQEERLKLKVEDLIVSVVKGRFTQRQEVKFILEKGG